MFVRYPPGRIRYEGDRPVALLGVPGPVVAVPPGRPAAGHADDPGPHRPGDLGVEPLFLQAQRDAAARYDQLAGTVYAPPSGEVPGGGSAAAVFR